MLLRRSHGQVSTKVLPPVKKEITVDAVTGKVIGHHLIRINRQFYQVVAITHTYYIIDAYVPDYVVHYNNIIFSNEYVSFAVFLLGLKRQTLVNLEINTAISYSSVEQAINNLFTVVYI